MVGDLEPYIMYVCPIHVEATKKEHPMYRIKGKKFVRFSFFLRSVVFTTLWNLAAIDMVPIMRASLLLPRHIEENMAKSSPIFPSGGCVYV